MLTFYLGVALEAYYLLWIGAGICCYGITYFLVHDVLIHRRNKRFDDTKTPYLKALRKAHKAHHKSH